MEKTIEKWKDIIGDVATGEEVSGLSWYTHVDSFIRTRRMSNFIGYERQGLDRKIRHIIDCEWYRVQGIEAIKKAIKEYKKDWEKKEGRFWAFLEEILHILEYINTDPQWEKICKEISRIDIDNETDEVKIEEWREWLDYIDDFFEMILNDLFALTRVRDFRSERPSIDFLHD